MCLSCGLCCDGSLYEIVGLYPDEVPVMTRLGLPIRQHGDDAFMTLGCAALDHTACTIYPERPRRCARFVCNLLAALNVGEVSLSEAHATVTMAKELEGPQREQFLDYHFRGRLRIRQR